MSAGDFDSMASFRRHAIDAAERAVERRCRRLTLVDPDFSAWPLDDAAWLDALTRFVQRPDRQVVMIGNRFDGVPRAFPRFVTWRRSFGHAFAALAPDEGVELPTLILADREIALRVLDAVRWRGRTVTDRHEVQLLADEVDALAQRCLPTFAVTTLGL